MADNYEDDAFEEEKISSMALPSISDKGSGHVAKTGMTHDEFVHAQDDNRKMIHFEAKFKKVRTTRRKHNYCSYLFYQSTIPNSEYLIKTLTNSPNSLPLY